MSPRIAQIVTFWFGPRRIEPLGYQRDKLYFVKKQLEAIDSFSSSIRDYYFVFNCNLEGFKDVFSMFTDAVELVHNHVKDKDYSIEVIRRNNMDGSYGGWNCVLKRVRGKYDYSILLEDDYAPSVAKYDEKLLKYLDEKTVYVCQRYARSKGGKRTLHPAVSNGMINNKIYDKHFDELGGFALLLKSSEHQKASYVYRHLEHNQRFFLQGFINKGYSVVDIENKYRVPFFKKDEIKQYGPKKAEALIEPIS